MLTLDQLGHDLPLQLRPAQREILVRGFGYRNQDCTSVRIRRSEGIGSSRAPRRASTTEEVDFPRGL
jgi:hypothetical protein